ncbi:TetR family transcriptional regulator [Nocardioides sp.]|uniref:TetR family transcriptional regulator n=1 Tax=Nocardioides sp. TaxID=35761 RepID=UPI0031FEAE4D
MPERELWVVGDELAMPTARRLILAAERLFAERGIDAVSLRAVNAAAGTNVASVNYHFGTKAELVEALILERSGEVSARRAALLDELERVGLTARGLAEAFVTPVAEMALSDGNTWVRFIAGILGSGHPALAVVTGAFTEQALRLTGLLEAIVPGESRETVRFRLAQAMSLTFRVLGDVDGVQDMMALSGVELSPQQVVEQLLDVVTAILAGPPG